MSTYRAVHAGLRPRAPVRMASSAPLFHPLTSYADATGSSLSAGDPAPRVKSTPPAGPPAQGWTGTTQNPRQQWG